MKNFWSKRIRDMVPYVPGEQPKDRKFIKLNTNENPYPPSPKALEAIRAAVGDGLRLYPDPECAELRDAIAEDETGEGFIYEMFLDELDNHEYGYTRDTEDTLYALGYTADEVLGNPRLKRGIEKAVTEICGRD